jgi:thiamine-monophosphate kinase
VNEFELIERLKKQLPANSSVVVGAGDDCAVLDFGLEDRYILFKTDAVVEGIHFGPSASPDQVGRKALARCLSDIAAMGGDPTAALVTIALPETFDPAWVEQLYVGMSQLASRYNVAIVGGETTTNPGQILISVSLLGTVSKKGFLERSGAQVGDAIFVSGELGGSLLGKHIEFEPRLAQGKWLASTSKVHAMIDLSDGLAGDLRHILKASQVGAELLSDSIPVSRAAKLQARGESAQKSPLLAALTDGEDFELLFTVAAKDAVSVLDGWKAAFPEVKLSCIGRIIAGSGVKLRTAEGLRELNVEGYAHFDKPSGN